MNTQPDHTGGDAAALDAFLTDVRRRVLLRDVAQATLASAAVLVVVLIAAWIGGVAAGTGALAGLLIAAVGLAGWLALRAQRWEEPALLPLVESRQPAFRNLLITSRELTQHPERAKPAMRALVLCHAAGVVRDTPVETIVPARDTTRAVAGAVGVLLAAVLVWYGASRWQTGDDRAGRVAGRAALPGKSAAAASAPAIRAITLVVTPPAYTGRPPVTLQNPTQVGALAGSRLAITVGVTDGQAAVSFNDQPQPLTPAAGHEFHGSLVLHANGVLTVAARRPSSAGAVAAGASDETPALIAVTVVPDQAPAVEIVAPGKDLLFSDTKARIEIRARAQDDFGVRSLTLRYTKVTGSGERYEFDEGELPLTLTRRDTREWEGRIARQLSALELNEGDLFVYYAVATDGRTTSAGEVGRTVSDSYVIEIGKPGTAIAGGFAIPPDEERFAISLNALIQKTERLHAQQATMAPGDFLDATQALAVEQRMVRSEFLFSMGSHGHVEDEEEEAAHSDEIQAGRLENRGQAELTMATRLMTRAEQHLTAADTGEALKAQRGALAAVQRALSRHRYFLRTLPTRGEIDLSRRLTGDLSGAASARLPLSGRTPDARAARVRAVLAELSRLARGVEAGNDRAALAALARAAATQVLALDPSSPALHAASANVTQAAQQIAAGRPRDSLPLVNKAAEAVLPLAQAASAAGSSPAPPRPAPPADNGLRGAVIDAVRTRGGAR